MVSTDVFTSPLTHGIRVHPRVPLLSPSSPSSPPAQVPDPNTKSLLYTGEVRILAAVHNTTACLVFHSHLLEWSTRDIKVFAGKPGQDRTSIGIVHVTFNNETQS